MAWLILLLLFVAPEAWAATTYYASSSGSGTTCSSGSPCTVATGLSTVVAGDTLVLKDGTYTGASSMIAPTTGKNGTATSRITVSCENDGACFINGENARIPIDLNNNDYWTIEGVNAANSNAEVVYVRSGSVGTIIRRVVAWNASSSTNHTVFHAVSTTDTLFEDVAGFGTGRKIFSDFGSGNNGTIFRRAWGVWEASTATGPKSTFQLQYNSVNDTCENCIGTWRTVQASVDQPTAIFRIGQDDNTNANTQILGSIGYMLSDAGSSLPTPGMLFHATPYNIKIQDVVLYNEKSTRPIQTRNTTPVDCNDCYLTRTTEIGGIASTIGSEWTANITNRIDVDTLGSTDIWDGASQANVCYRYESRVLTSTPLWPWPMDSRINAALTAAGNDPDDYFGTGNTLTDKMEELFGAIPSACRTDTVTPPAAYTVLELGSEAAPDAWDHATFTNANVANYQGSITAGTPCNAALVHKILWDDAATDIVYHSISCPDAVHTAGTATEDHANIVTEAADKVDFRWKNNQTTTCDANTFRIIVNISSGISDGDCNGGTFTTTTDLTSSTVVVTVAATSWHMFIKHNLGFSASAGTAYACQASLIDRDTSSEIRYFNGDSVTDLADWGLCTFSATTVTPPAAAGHTIEQTAGAYYHIIGNLVTLPQSRAIKTGRFLVRVQVDVTVDDAPATDYALYYRVNGADAQAVQADFSGGAKVKFYSAADSTVLTHGTAVADCISGALTPVSTIVYRTGIPVALTMNQDTCAAPVFAVEVSDDFSANDALTFELRKSDGTVLDDVTNATLTVLEYQATR